MNGVTRAQHAQFSGSRQEDDSGQSKKKKKLVGNGVQFERIRRITGYLVGTLDRFNDAKRAEEHDRIKHG